MIGSIVSLYVCSSRTQCISYAYESVELTHVMLTQPTNGPAIESRGTHICHSVSDETWTVLIGCRSNTVYLLDQNLSNVQSYWMDAFNEPSSEPFCFDYQVNEQRSC